MSVIVGERRKRIALFLLLAFAMGPGTALAQILVRLVSRHTAWSWGVFVDCFNMSVALGTLYLARLEVYGLGVRLCGFWKPNHNWMAVSLFMIPYGLCVLASRGDAAGWVVSTTGVLTLMRCLRYLWGDGQSAR